MKRLFPFLAVAFFLPGRTGADPAPTFRWANVVMGGGGFVSAIVASPARKNLFYARTDVGGAYRWSEAEQSWTPLTDWLPPEMLGVMGVESIATDPRAPEKVYLVGGTPYWQGGRTCVLRSNDYGDTWKSADVTDLFRANGNGMGRQNGERLAVDPNLGSILFFGSRSRGLFKSADAGVSWNRVSSLAVTETSDGAGISFVVFDPSSGRAGRPTPTVYLGVSRREQNLYVSKDAGRTWTLVPGAPKGLNPQRNAFASDGMLYITYGNGAGPHADPATGEAMDRGAVWKLDPRNGRWTDITPPDRPNAYSGVSVAASDPRRVALSSINSYRPQPGGFGDRIYLSVDGGGRWRDYFAEKTTTLTANGFPWMEGASIHWAGCIVIDPFRADRAFVTSGQGVFMTNNLAASSSTWMFAGRGIEETVPSDLVCIPGGPMISTIGDYDGFVHDDVKKAPALGRHTASMGSCRQITMAGLPPHALARVGSQLQFSDDHGKSWKVADGKPSGEAANGGIALSADGKVLLWNVRSGDHAGVLYRTEDRGRSWQPASGIHFPGTPVGDPVNPAKFYLIDSETGFLWTSMDAGRSFQKAAEVGRGSSRWIRTVPGREGYLWLAAGDAGLKYSSDSGRTFQKVANVPFARAVGVGKSAPGSPHPAIYVYGRVGKLPAGVYGSTNLGQSWVRIDDPQHLYGGMGNAQLIQGDANVFGRVYMSTAGRGIVYAEPVNRAAGANFR